MPRFFHPNTKHHCWLEPTFWIGTVLIGNVIPLALLVFAPSATMLTVSAILVLIGIYATEKIWVEAPQRIPLA